jgi:hypothetical protein
VGRRKPHVRGDIIQI